MIEKIDFQIASLLGMKKYPDNIFYIGNKNLLNQAKISIVGTRKPSQYTKIMTSEISKNVIYNNKLNSTRINLTGI